MSDSPAAAPATPAGPPALALAVAYDLVTRHRLRLTDPADSRLGEMSGGYLLGAASWTGRRAAFVGFYEPPADPEAAATDLAARCEAATRWSAERLRLQGAERCDVLLVALGPVPRPPSPPAAPPQVRVGALSVDAAAQAVTALLAPPGGMPSAGDVRTHLRALERGHPAPTLAAVDLAERQTVAAGYTQPVRRATVSTPVATYSMIALLVAVYLLERSVLGSLHGSAPVTLEDMGALCSGPVRTFRDTCDASDPGQWWRLASSAVLHDPGGSLPIHIIGNGFALYFLGRFVEQLYGRVVLVGTFVVTAVLGGLFWIACTSAGVASAGVGIGASGGICGLMGLLIMLGRVQGRDVPAGVATYIRQYAVSYAVLTILFSVVVPNVNNFVHVGGFVSGVLLGLVIPPQDAVGGRRMRAAEQGVLLAFSAVAVVALGVAVQHLGSILSTAPGVLPGF